MQLGGVLVSGNGKIAICHGSSKAGEVMAKDKSGSPVLTKTNAYVIDLKVMTRGFRAGLWRMDFKWHIPHIIKTLPDMVY